MNASEILTMYEKVADAPDAVEKLRRLILELAVSGKLTDYVPSEDEVHQLGTIADFIMGQAPPGNNCNEDGVGTPFVKVGEFGALFPERSAWTTKPLKSAKAGDVLICVVGATIGKLNLAIDCAIGRSVAAIRPGPSLDQLFLFHSLRPYMLKLRADSRGTAQGVIGRPELHGISIWVPPLSEQHRIVAKVDELMALCDQLEDARKEREAARDCLTAASLARLNAPDPDTFQDDARFALNVLPALTARPDQIKKLRETILNLAVRGKLVPQSPLDTPALASLVESGSVRQDNTRASRKHVPPESDASETSGQSSLQNWSRVSWSQVSSLVTSGSRGWSEYYSTSGAGFIRAQNIRFGTLQLDSLARVNPPKSKEGVRTRVEKGDLLVVITGAGVTNPAILEVDLGEAYVSQHVALIRPVDTRLSRWLLLCLMAEAGGRAELVKRAYGSGKPGLNLENIRSLVSPLPPLAEQQLIIERVDQLMAFCDKLEASLTRIDSLRTDLLDALQQVVKS